MPRFAWFRVRFGRFKPILVLRVDIRECLDFLSDRLLEDRAIAERRTIAAMAWGLLANLTYYGSYAWIVLRTVAGRHVVK